MTTSSILLDDLRFKIALNLTEGIGGIMFRHLLAYFGTAEAVFAASPEKLQKVQGIGRNLSQEIRKSIHLLSTADGILEKANREGVAIYSYQDTDYPKRLKSLYDCPPLIYSKGQVNYNVPRCIGIVGTRNATEAGKAITQRLIEDLTPYGVTVVSGLAYGIDIEAHKAALKQGLPTIGVLASGLDIIYPAVHKKYVPEILVNGALVSENRFGAEPVRQQFLTRNRIIAGLSDVVIVIESAKKGGSLVTAEYANNYHREVFAVPGSLGNKFSEGTNWLIRQNKAQIFTETNDIIEQLNWDLNEKEAATPAEKEIDWSRFTEEESRILRIFHEKQEVHIDALSFESNIPLNRLAGLLLNFEFQDLIKALPGKKFRVK